MKPVHGWGLHPPLGIMPIHRKGVARHQVLTFSLSFLALSTPDLGVLPV